MTGQGYREAAHEGHNCQTGGSEDHDAAPLASQNPGHQRSECDSCQHWLVVGRQGQDAARHGSPSSWIRHNPPHRSEATAHEFGWVDRMQGEVQAAHDSCHVEDLGMQPEDIREGRADEKETNRIERRQGRRVESTQVGSPHPDHRHQQQHVQRHHAVGAKDPDQGRSHQGVDVGLAEEGCLPPIIGHQDEIEGGEIGILVEEAAQIPHVALQIPIVSQTLCHQVVGRLICLEGHWQTRLPHGQGKNHQEQSQAGQNQSRHAAHCVSHGV